MHVSPFQTDGELRHGRGEQLRQGIFRLLELVLEYRMAVILKIRFLRLEEVTASPARGEVKTNAFDNVLRELA